MTEKSYVVYADAVIQFEVTQADLDAYFEEHGRRISPNEFVKQCKTGRDGTIATWTIDKKATVTVEPTPERKVIRSSQSY